MKKRKAIFVKNNEKCILRFEAQNSFCLEKFSDFPSMGRVNLRDEKIDQTVGIGKVVKIVE